MTAATAGLMRLGPKAKTKAMAPRRTRLPELLEGLAASPVPDLPVRALQYDSRQVQPGDCFIAVPGEKADGGRFIADALARGAAAVVAEKGTGLGVVLVKDARRVLSLMAARFYGEPSRRMAMIGITGTKGKTTTSYFLESILSVAGLRPGVIGTVNYRWPGVSHEAGRTTPESLDLQRMLFEMREAGAEAAVMEVSSHALVLGRTADVAFDRTVFTNLASDHMDYHRTPEAYRDAKGLLFSGMDSDGMAVLNADDPVSEHYRSLCRAPVTTYGMDHAADCTAQVIEAAWDSTRIHLETLSGPVDARLCFVGKHNVMNALAAAATALSMGLEPKLVAEGLGALQRVPGRLERVPCALPFRVFIDYAHTEDSLRSLLVTARAFTQGRIVLVFGCGGDRDRGKRPKMGAVAQQMADVAIVTSDNPRSEKPGAIIEEIRASMTGAAPYRVEPDRASAIRLAVAEARAGDTVLIAGKGHERGQILADRTVPFDDMAEARSAVAAREEKGV